MAAARRRRAHEANGKANGEEEDEEEGEEEEEAEEREAKNPQARSWKARAGELALNGTRRGVTGLVAASVEGLPAAGVLASVPVMASPTTGA